ncbi:MAG TPA: hypothetical protein HA362_04720 [Nanoarchaeota archaeon]|nr:hypothetical protein [Nanoarchaeota archaeon]
MHSREINMTEIHFNAPVKLEDIKFDVTLDRQRNPLPQDVQQRVDTAFNAFADKAEAKSGKRPTKGQNCVLANYRAMPNGLEGVCKIATFDEVLYFARSQIPGQDYEFGRKQVGFPIASWGVLLSNDNQLLFARKRGAEGAYEGSPYSAFGTLVSADKDIEKERISPGKLLERSVAGEAGKAIWERRKAINYLGLNVYDENSAKVNNGYDTVWEIAVDAGMEEIMALLEENPQFEAKSKASPVIASPERLTDFAAAYPTTTSGLSGIFNYIGSKFGHIELLNQYARYMQAMGTEARDLKFCPVR